MKKIEQLIGAIETGNKKKALQLTEALYNDLRDFSQCFTVDYDEKKNELHIDHGGRLPQYVAETKYRIREWVGGY